MLLGDFICMPSIRSSIQLAWGLGTHLDTMRVFSDRERRNIAFPVFKF